MACGEAAAAALAAASTASLFTLAPQASAQMVVDSDGVSIWLSALQQETTSAQLGAEHQAVTEALAVLGQAPQTGECWYCSYCTNTA